MSFESNNRQKNSNNNNNKLGNSGKDFCISKNLLGAIEKNNTTICQIILLRIFTHSLLDEKKDNDR